MRELFGVVDLFGGSSVVSCHAIVVPINESFIQPIIIEHLLCDKHCSKHLATTVVKTANTLEEGLNN